MFNQMIRADRTMSVKVVSLYGFANALIYIDTIISTPSLNTRLPSINLKVKGIFKRMR